MKITDLIEYLQKQDQSLEVFVDGYEGGYTEPKYEFKDIALNVGNASYCGEHSEHEGFNEWSSHKDILATKALILAR